MKAPVSKNTSRCNCVIVGRHGDQGNKCFRFPVWLQSRLHSRGLYQYLYKEFQPNPVGDPLLWVSAFHWWTMKALDNRTKAVHWPGWTRATLLHTVQRWLKRSVKIGYIHMLILFCLLTQKSIQKCWHLIKDYWIVTWWYALDALELYRCCKTSSRQKFFFLACITMVDSR